MPGLTDHFAHGVRAAPLLAGILVALHGCGTVGAPAITTSQAPARCPAVPSRLAGQKIQHVLIVMQENRSFDHYFGTFPGAEGIPVDSTGAPTVCIPDPKHGGCAKPYHLTTDLNVGGPHSANAFALCYDGGKLDGFLKSAQTCGDPTQPCTSNPDVMGYHTDAELPNYWAYARGFALHDHMFESIKSWSLVAHSAMVSAWSAECTADNPMSCSTNLNSLGTDPCVPPCFVSSLPKDNHQPWTDITYLLHQQDICWRYYLSQGPVPHCGSGNAGCPPVQLDALVPNIWNPLPDFDDVADDGELGNIQVLDNFYQDVEQGTLPEVAWIAPSKTVSEHPPALISNGQAFVTSIVNTIMQSKYWESTVIFVSWDDWGGFYDHVQPPQLDAMGLGFRVPALTISPWVKQAGLIDKQVLSHDSYLRFIEDIFLGGQRLDPKTDGRPDSRPFVREESAKLGDLRNDFDFTRTPLPPMLLPVQ